MATGRPIETDAVLTVLTVLLESNRADLIDGYDRALRQTLFSNRADVRPAILKRIALDEADALQNYLHGASSGVERGRCLAQLGLSEQAVLALGHVTRQFFVSRVEPALIVQTLDIVCDYQGAVLQGFMESLVQIIRAEQERIRGALQTAVKHYTVEIQEVQDLAQRAAASSEFKTQFMAHASHELRTPLGALIGMSEMLQENIYGPLTPQQQDIVQRIMKNARALERFFSDLLDQSLLESGRLRLKKESFSPHEVVKSVYSTSLPLALRKGLSLHVEPGQNAPHAVVGDRARTEQVLTNLVVNAIKFTESGGVVIHFRDEGDSHWAMQVEDTGIGISEDDLERIFEPFRQAGESVASGRGVGLGLAIVQQLVTAMGGRASVKSKVGQGSTFTVVLPLRPAEGTEGRA